ncbi:SRPBCC family protein [Flindersiella endophytica]
MTDNFDAIGNTERQLHDHESGLKTVLIRRAYNAGPEDVWDALTDPDRLVRWFLPIAGDLRVGGRYSLEGNASGQIVRCDPPHEIGLTWEIGGGSSDVIVRLTAKGEQTVLELEHSPIPQEVIPNPAPGHWGLGSGWEMGFIALGSYLAGEMPEGRAIDALARTTPEKLAELGELSTRISEAWVAVIAREA